MGTDSSRPSGAVPGADMPCPCRTAEPLPKLCVIAMLSVARALSPDRREGERHGYCSLSPCLRSRTPCVPHHDRTRHGWTRHRRRPPAPRRRNRRLPRPLLRMPPARAGSHSPLLATRKRETLEVPSLAAGHRHHCNIATPVYLRAPRQLSAIPRRTWVRDGWPPKWRHGRALTAAAPGAQSSVQYAQIRFSQRRISGWRHYTNRRAAPGGDRSMQLNGDG